VRIFISAGETSGDRHAADLVHALKAIDPHVEVSGFGGRALLATGAEIDTTLIESPIIGVAGIPSRLLAYRRLIRDATERMVKSKTDVLVLVDYPGFNLRLATAAKRAGIKTAYYIGPQIWAWGAGRTDRMRRDIDLMLVVFEFERELYEKAGVAVRFVGHPLLDQLDFTPDPSFRHRHGLDPDAFLMGLFPGSRPSEINRLLPVMLQVVTRLRKSHPKVQWACATAPGLARDRYDHWQRVHNERVPLVDAAAHSLMKSADFALVASGTATLETAMLGTPLFVLYRTDPITYLLGRIFLKISSIGLVNVVAERQVAPEFIQYRCQPGLIAHAASDYLSHAHLKEHFGSIARELTSRLGQPGAAGRGAQAIAELAQL
jgi:lipid-A-disaccharide synthase